MTRAGRIQASQQAINLLDELGLDRNRPVDPFEVLDNLGLEVRFEEMDNVLGFILPTDPVHVVINKQRPASVQRFTAGHELGHWVLDHGVFAVDTERQVSGQDGAEREQNAQVFASNFLMPLDLIYETADRLFNDVDHVPDPLQVYEMSREMRVSYLAAVNRLADVQVLSSAQRQSYAKQRPIDLKTRLAGSKPDNSRGDVWVVDKEHQGYLELDVTVDDQITIQLPENPSTGYTWSTVAAEWFAEGPLGGRAEQHRLHSDESSISVLKETFDLDPEADNRVGGDGMRTVSLSPRDRGSWMITMKNVRPFDREDEPIAETLLARVRSTPQDELKAIWIERFKIEDALLAHIETESDRDGD